MGFIEAIKTCYSKSFTFSGRASRSEFWWFYLATIIISYVVSAICGTGSTTAIFISCAITFVLTFFPSLAVSVRRLRDAGFSPWWLLIALTGIGAIVLFIMWLQKSK
ncbi:MAG: DUF805 domain-containing protein [Marinilabiliaceae bacterium]|nr:DUF805 domain-containing protein [Marinilabiliaceae bacterium]